MRFDSLEFIAFMAVVLLLERCMRGGLARKLLLLLASYAFYASWNPPFVALLLGSTLLDFGVGLWMGRTTAQGQRRFLLLLSLVGNLGVLAFFKYGGMFQDVARLVPTLDLDTAFPRRDDLIIPLGISFYTFQTISYTIDVYRKRIEPCRDFLAFALFVTFFPQLIAGPVMRAGKLLPQIAANRHASAAQIRSGVELFLLGIIKKVVVADNLAILVDAVWSDPAQYSAGALSLAMFAFMGQIYCDFSGYSTMARGLGRLFGFELPRNFNYPMLAKNPVESLMGWHITMSQWFRDYVYLPLVGGRTSRVVRSLGILLTWTLFGLWHGGTWVFLLWGLFNGARIVLYRQSRRRLGRLRDTLAWNVGGRMATPLVFSVTCVLFRSPDLHTVGLFFSGLLAWGGQGDAVSAGWLVLLVGLLAIHIACKRWYREDLMARLGPTARVALVAGSTMLISVFAGTENPFIYFQF
jgi:alginate O-acetyltransferase complex protein AlgI